MRKPARERPIGVFDSGIGGLTVFKALRRRLPREDILYFGDIAHLPYGEKSAAAVTRHSLDAAKFLARRGAKFLVVACNTASSVALPAIAKALKIPLLGVIGPGARAAVEATRSGRVGIIGTGATIASGAYVRAVRERLKSARVAAAACPLFVPLVEEGWWSHPVAAVVARSYLAPIKAKRVDCLILGCTHYPLLKATLAKIMGPKVSLIDSAEQTASEAQELLRRLGLEARRGGGRQRFFVSDNPERFIRVARRLAGIRASEVELIRFD